MKLTDPIKISAAGLLPRFWLLYAKVYLDISYSNLISGETYSSTNGLTVLIY